MELVHYPDDQAALQKISKYITAGKIVVIPTDTVYGLAVNACDEDACSRLYALKQRPITQPTAVIFSSVKDVFESLGEMSLNASALLKALLPGPYTFIVSNPQRRFAWLCGTRKEVIGVRVPDLALPGLPPLCATSANERGEPTVVSPIDLPQSMKDQVAACLLTGQKESQGEASTVIDISVWEESLDPSAVLCLRDTAGRFQDALAQISLLQDLSPAG